jgi:hypothetical protein
MKKNPLKKLRLSRETLRSLTGLEIQKVVGGSELSCPSDCADAYCPPTTYRSETGPTETVTI